MKKKKQFLIKIGKRLLGLWRNVLLSVIVFYFARLAPGTRCSLFTVMQWNL